jgi:cyclic 2,3-diphosphoglycerate synthetase
LKEQWEAEIVGMVFAGGREKLASLSEYSSFDFPLIMEEGLLKSLKKALLTCQPEVVVDISDEPIMGYRERFQAASLILSLGVSYVGADFRFDPPPREEAVKKPSISIIGSGKRVGKTAISAFLARLLKRRGFHPIIVAMGRGGPPQPEVLKGEKIKLTPQLLLDNSLKGKHAASDYFEDALVSEVTTVGARRCGGGLGGAPFFSNVLEAAEVADKTPGSPVVFEGSGAAIPPVRTDKTILVVSAHLPLEHILGYLGPLRVYLSDFIVLTQCEEPLANRDKVKLLDTGLRDLKSSIKIVWTRFRPQPLEDISGEKIFYATTFSSLVREKIRDYLEERFQCEVVGISTNLSQRDLLKKEISLYEDRITAVLTEVKAAAVEVVTKFALERGVRIVYVDNVPESVGGDGSLEEVSMDVLQGVLK